MIINDNDILKGCFVIPMNNITGENLGNLRFITDMITGDFLFDQNNGLRSEINQAEYVYVSGHLRFGTFFNPLFNVIRVSDDWKKTEIKNYELLDPITAPAPITPDYTTLLTALVNETLVARVQGVLFTAFKNRYGIMPQITAIQELEIASFWKNYLWNSLPQQRVLYYYEGWVSYTNTTEPNTAKYIDFVSYINNVGYTNKLQLDVASLEHETDLHCNKYFSGFFTHMTADASLLIDEIMIGGRLFLIQVDTDLFTP